jgi:hypothetical protein
MEKRTQQLEDALELFEQIGRDLRKMKNFPHTVEELACKIILKTMELKTVDKE